MAGLLGVSITLGGFTIASPRADAAEASLYEQYQNEQKLAAIKAQIKKLQDEEAKANKSVTKADNSIKNAVPSSAIVNDDPNNIVNRVKAIISEYDSSNKKDTVKKSKLSSEMASIKKNDLTKKTIQQHTEKPQSSLSAIFAASSNKSSIAKGNARRYNFDWRGTPLPQSIYGVAKIAGKGVVINTEIKGNVYMSLKQVTCDQALDYLARAFGINWMSDGNNIIVSTGTLMQQSQTFDVSYANKENMKEELKSMGISADNIYANPETGTISVTGTPYQLEQAQKRLERIDKPVAQCLLLAQMIEIDHGKSLDLGMTYSLPTYAHTGSETSSNNSFAGNWLEKLTFSSSSTASRSLSKGKVIARPMILSLNGQKGAVNFGDRVPILTRTDTGSSNTLTVTYQDVGTNLEVTPVINEKSGDITLTIKTEVSNITGWVSSGDTKAPQMSTRTATTSTHVKSGQSFVIGGLMNAKELDSLSGIPGLMDLPILGKLFSYHSHTKDYAEVYVMITPFIISDDTNAQTMYDELKHLDAAAKKDEITIPQRDWAKNIGKHKLAQKQGDKNDR